MPHVSAAAAIIKSYVAEATVEEVRMLLRRSQIPLSPNGNIMEGIAGRLSLRLLMSEIADYKKRPAMLSQP